MSFQTDWMMVRSDLCVEHWLLSDSLCKQKSHWIITINGKMNVWKCKLIFPMDTLQQKIEITDLKPFLSGENTSVLIILATTVLCKYVYMYRHRHVSTNNFVISTVNNFNTVNNVYTHWMVYKRRKITAIYICFLSALSPSPFPYRNKTRESVFVSYCDCLAALTLKQTSISSGSLLKAWTLLTAWSIYGFIHALQSMA